MAPARLITIPISHFCEKARWALDRAQVPYREERHLQGIHVVHALRAARSRTLPILVTADGVVLTESAAIVRWCDGALPDAERLYPDGPEGVDAARLEAWLDGGFGPDGRLWMYEATLPMMARMESSIVDGIPAWERGVFRHGRWALNPFIRRYLDVSPATAAAALARADLVFDAVAERLGDGRRYLCGERFTAADLAFAAFCAPFVVPAEYGSPLPPLTDLAPAMATQVTRLRAHPAGRFALRVYAEHRWAAGQSAPLLRA